jgi:3-methyladenine DNA glycosylase AlkD
MESNFTGIINSKEIIEYLKSMRDENNISGMSRFGISSVNTLGVTMPEIRAVAKQIKKNNMLALELWDSEIHECRILAALIAEPKEITPETMDKWVSEMDSWDVCDQACFNLFDKTPYAKDKVFQWAISDFEFTRRAAFALLAGMAIHWKKVNDELFLPYFDLIYQYSTDERNFVKKAVNWALRQIGKRSYYLSGEAIELSERILSELNFSKSAQWIAKDAIKELTNEKIRFRIKR